MRHVLIALAVSALAAASPAQEMLDQQRREEARRHYRAGEEYMMSEAFEKAADEFKKATEKDPAFALAFYSLGQARMALKQYPAAVEAYTSCKDLFLREATMDRQAKAEMDRQRRDEIQDLEQSLVRVRSGAIKGGPAGSTMESQQVALEQRISVLKDQQHRDEKGGHQVPAELSLGLGSAYFRMNQMDQAEQNYRAAIGANGKLGAAHNNLAVILMLSDRLDEAEREIKAAEKAGFTVSAKFKEDLKQRLSTKKP
jgi:tetratricopeptide (TPR) repeat protein